MRSPAHAGTSLLPLPGWLSWVVPAFRSGTTTIPSFPRTWREGVGGLGLEVWGWGGAWQLRWSRGSGGARRVAMGRRVRWGMLRRLPTTVAVRRYRQVRRATIRLEFHF